MALKRMVLQIGMGTDIRGADYTKAAVRALRDALWHNSLSVADAVGLAVDSFRIEHREVMQRLGIASLPRGDIVAARGLEVLLHAEPFFVHPA